MASCEMCGKECKAIPAKIDGVTMMVCHDCLRHGEAIQVRRPAPPRPSSSTPFRSSKPPRKDVFQGMEKELVADWSAKIQKARKKKGLSREQLGFRIGQRTVTISKMENGDLRPSDNTVKKLEKELGISLLEQVQKVDAGERKQSFSSGGRYTLGDFIKTEE